MVNIIFISFSLLVLLVVIAADNAPEQISLNYGASPSEMVAMWAVVGASSTEGAICEFGTSPDNLDQVATATSSSYSVRTPAYTSPMIFKATMTNLVPGNKIYFYRVGSQLSGFSEVFSFKTNPGIGKLEKPVTFHLLGDVGQTTNSVSTLQQILDIDQLLDSFSAGIVNVGDLSYANGNEPLWDSFGKLKQFMAAKVPMFSTVGNHEWFDSINFDFTAFKTRFDAPKIAGSSGDKQLYYSFDIGLAHWVMVSGYCQEMKSVATQPCLAKGSPEMTWLQADLAAVDRSVTPWVFVVFHQPYVNSNTAHSIAAEGAPMQAAIEDTLYAAKVDMVFSGHVHAYERSCRVYRYNCVADAPYYITIGDGGNAEGLATEWVSPQPIWSAFRQASYGHGELTVVNSTHSLWEWHQNIDLVPLVADSLWIVKDVAGESVLGGVTKKPVFADTARGLRAALFEAQMKSAPHHNKIN